MIFMRQWGWIFILILFPFTAFYASGIDNGSSHDKLKYLSIAWSMMQNHQYLIPMVNGVPYTDKPPLFFWLIVGVWHLFGTNMFAVQCLIDMMIISWVFILRALYLTVFPNDHLGRDLIPYVLIGAYPIWSNIWFLRVDLLLLTGILLCNLGIFRELAFASFPSKKCSVLSIIFIASGCCIGLLAKGPVFYVFTWLPFLVSAIFTRNYRKYLFKIISAIFLGTFIVLAVWVIPAILSMDHAFAEQILYRQISHRALYSAKSPSFLEKSYFIYLYQYIPILFFPWIINCLFFKKFRVIFSQLPQHCSFILFIMLVSIVIFSIFGQKSVWYVLPLLPFGLIFFTRFFVENKDQSTVILLNQVTFSFLFGLLGALSIGLLLSSTIQSHIFKNFGGHFLLSPIIMLSMAGINFFMALYLWRSKFGLLKMVSASSVMLFLTYSLSKLYFFPFELRYTNINNVASYLYKQEQSNDGLALYQSDYLGQFTYVARLKKSILQLNTFDELKDWLQRHPQGIVLYFGKICPSISGMRSVISFNESARSMPFLLCQINQGNSSQ